MTWQKINLKIPDTLDPSQRLQLADLIVEHIYERTNQGVDKNGRAFPKYSKEYIKSLDFKNAGKSASKVDLQLSGDMLAALKLLNHRTGNLMIGFENGTEENSKAEGNILGTYGQSSSGKKRDFLGIQPAKLKELIRYVSGTSATESSGNNEEN